MRIFNNRLVALMCMLMTLSVAGNAYPDTSFYYAYELKGAPIQVKTPGEYRIWVWFNGQEDSSINIGENEFAVRDRMNRLAENDAVWIPVGKLNLEHGKVSGSAGMGVLAIVLTNKEGFRPEGIEKMIRVQPGIVPLKDPRVEIERHTDTVFEMTKYPDLESWEQDAVKLRRLILASSGLYPLPEKTPLNAHVFDKKEYGDYSIEKVYFEAYPGFLVTGNLFRPLGKTGPFPGVLCPHGHWEHGRLEDSDKSSVSARAITLARMGMVAFAYDMLAYNDSMQFKNHRFVDFEDLPWGIHPFALQLWSSIRGADFLESLPEVDKDRLACTGASGGGTQTFALSAVEPRIKVSAPVNMISHTMQGGCVCENAPFVRMQHSNMEIGALAAPRPMLMVAATGDWTKNTPTVEFPAVRSIYELYGAADKLESVQFDTGHNYNKDSRTAVYRFLGKYLLPDQDWSTFEEPDYSLPSAEEMRVFPDGKLPEAIPTDEDAIKAAIKEQRRKQLSAVLAQDKEEYAGVFKNIFAEILNVNPSPEVLIKESSENESVSRYLIHSPIVLNDVPMIGINGNTARSANLIVHPRGKHAVIDPETGKAYQNFLDAEHGGDVYALDVFLAGEYADPIEGISRAGAKSFDDTFLPADTGYRVQDILVAVNALKKQGYENVHLTGIGMASFWVLLAAAISEDVTSYKIDETVLPVGDKTWASDRRDHLYYVPGIQALGGVGMLKKLAPT